MSNDNVLENLFKQWTTISQLIIDGKRDPKKVKCALESIIAGKQLVEATPIFQAISGDWGSFYKDMFIDWGSFYKEVFDIEPDLSGVIIPDCRHGFTRLLVIAQGMTPQCLFDKCSEQFPSFKCMEGDLDKMIISDRTSQNSHYAIWIRDRIEADEENKDVSANKFKSSGSVGITLEEQVLYELKFFQETMGGHLDISHKTLCSGSLTSFGEVPCTGWVNDEFEVDWRCADFHRDDLRPRSVAS